MRAAIGMIVIEFPSPYATDAMDYLNKGIALRDHLREEPLLSFCIAPHAPYTVSDKAFERIAVMLGELDVRCISTCTRPRVKSRKAWRNTASARSPGYRIWAGGFEPDRRPCRALVGPGSRPAFLTWLSCRHCPSSNLKLASGIEPPARLLDSSINVGLGTDGAASNNRQDIFSEMRLAALIAKGATGDPP